MPHKGRTYPYAVHYWATEGWFWPGFVPWRMHLLFASAPGLPWSLLSPGTELISDPVIYQNRDRRARYTFTIVSGLVYVLTVDLQVVSKGINGLVSWFLTMKQASVVQGTAMELQPYPQRVVFSDATIQTYPGCVSGGGVCPTGYVFRPATYAEGGSPYP